MSQTPQSASDVCTHERGPGTTLCLHCRREARIVARDKRKRNLLRGTTATIIVATLSTVGALSARALRSRGESSRKGDASRGPTPQTTESLAVNSVPADTTTVPTAAPASVQAKPMVSPTKESAAVIQAGAPAQPIAAKAVAAKPVSVKVVSVKAAATPLAPVIAMGTTALGDGVVATRTDAGVTLEFDTPVTRTRIPEKFERFLRATLPNVYGRDVESALAAIPLGALTRQGNLLTDLPTRGIRVPMKDAGTLVVYPETRPGQDGPLVVRYRTALVPPGK